MTTAEVKFKLQIICIGFYAAGMAVGFLIGFLLAK